MPNSLPALQKAQGIQKKVARVGFDWKRREDVIGKIEEELEELKDAVKRDRDIESELGDLLFSVVNLSRFLGYDAENDLRKTIGKFARRFQYIETRLTEAGRTLEACTLNELDAYWEEAKTVIREQ